mgnify:CR=1 FL=1
MEEETLGVIIERLENLKLQNAEEHKRIEEQTTRTNGQVASLKLWQARILGALGILSAIIIPILFMFLSRYIDGIK